MEPSAGGVGAAQDGGGHQQQRGAEAAEDAAGPDARQDETHELPVAGSVEDDVDEVDEDKDKDKDKEVDTHDNVEEEGLVQGESAPKGEEQTQKENGDNDDHGKSSDDHDNDDHGDAANASTASTDEQQVEQVEQQEQEQQEKQQLKEARQQQDEEEQSIQREKAERAWLRRQKNVVIFSRAGKPIYSSGGDEFQLSSIFGLLQAMLAKTDDRLRVIRAGKNFVIVFAARGPLLLAAASRGQEPVGYLQVQLEYIYAQILFHFTLTALMDTFRRRPGYDMRGMLGGARTELLGVVELAESTPTLMLEAVPTLAIPQDARTQAINTLYTARQSNLLYAILLADDKLVAYISPKRHPLHASDLVLLINFVHNAKQLRSQETWTPLCLPAFNSTGFLHAYAAYLSEHLCLLLLSSGESLDQFHFCSETKTKIASQLASTGLQTRLERALAAGDIAPEACEAATSVHLVYRSLKFDQYFETRVASHAPLHKTPPARRRLLSRYVNVSERLHSNSRRIQAVAPLPSAQDGNGDGQYPQHQHQHSQQQQQEHQQEQQEEEGSKFSATSYIDSCEQGHLWDVRETEAVLAVVSPGQYELYAAFHIFTSATQAMACVARFAAWARAARHERFMSKPATW
ncbi:Vacuolar fusion protein MON1 [Hondaea fermentalgiana]|uniref:Vacuolar fusion protein MON1 n=1 Tax=Hondaea fermentalgiana TaxID=2315210 RepID=A0A2R5G9B4_9STRA|nr:Vacuolar fusion protein MON1 [Hondaea fermentalgiana]|eukprot:GBG27125.1 Vacuolar fusion protein MON1 [Hondaea fermentalgiana]